MTCYQATVRDVCGYTGLLAGSDRDVAESIVRNVYLELMAGARRGDAESVGFGYLRRAVRDGWVDRLRAHTDVPRQRADGPVHLLAELSPGERTVMVLRFVDEMPTAQVASELGASERAIEQMVARGLCRLGRDEVTLG
ncbi:MAG: sigma-70 family RNA polymerase sigma factor [Ilumatobacteraceae bacterium]